MNNVYISNIRLLYEYFVLDKLYQNNDSIKSFLCYEKVFKSLNASKEFKIFIKLIKYM